MCLNLIIIQYLTKCLGLQQDRVPGTSRQILSTTQYKNFNRKQILKDSREGTNKNFTTVCYFKWKKSHVKSRKSIYTCITSLVVRDLLLTKGMRSFQRKRKHNSQGRRTGTGTLVTGQRQGSQKSLQTVQFMYLSISYITKYRSKKVCRLTKNLGRCNNPHRDQIRNSSESSQGKTLIWC